MKRIEGHERVEGSYLGSEWQSEDLARHEAELDEGHGLFFAFSMTAVIILSLLLFFVVYLVAPRLNQFHPLLPVILTYMALAAVSIAATGLFLTFITVLTGKKLIPSMPWGRSGGKGIVMLLTPAAVKLGGMMGVSRDRIASSFIKVNNALVMSAQKSRKSKSVLILLPRCIQNSKCKQKVEIDIKNCKDCGLCDIADIIRICEENSIESFVATGGNLARKLIKEKRPSGVIGVACERELLSGIHDTSGLPVIGIPNLRPDGPCIDTRIDLEKLDAAVKSFIS